MQSVLRTLPGVFFLATFLLFAIDSPLSAEKIILKNGQALQGRIVDSDEETVTLKMSHGTTGIDKKQIREVRTDAGGKLSLDNLNGSRSVVTPDVLKDADKITTPRKTKSDLDNLEEYRSQKNSVHLRNAVARATALEHAGALRQAVESLSVDVVRYGTGQNAEATLAEMRCRLAYDYIKRKNVRRAVEQISGARDNGAPIENLRYLLGLLLMVEERDFAARYEIGLALRDEPSLVKIFPPTIEGPLTDEILSGRLRTDWENPKNSPLVRVVRRKPGKMTPEIEELIEKYSDQFGVPKALVVAVIEAESAFDPNAVSTAGAKGLMQLMPGTARDMGVTDVLDPDENIRGGTRYLSLMLGRFEKSLKQAVAAYNAGPEAVSFHGDVPPYPETKNYVEKVLARYHELVVSLPKG